MRSKTNKIAWIVLICTFGYIIGKWDIDNRQIRQLAKQKLRLEIQLLKIQIEQQGINLQKEY